MHGLGHLLLCPGNDIDREKMCHRFAGAMLAPRTAVFKKLGIKRKDLDLDYELPKLKEEFGMSIQAWINRACDLRIIDESTRVGLYWRIGRRGWKVNEPVYIPIEIPSRFRLMVSRARAEGVISPVKASAYLGLLHRKLRTPLKESDVPAYAASDYSPEGALNSWGDVISEGSANA